MNVPENLELHSPAELDAHLQRASSLARCIVQSVDLTGRGAQLATVEVRGALFLGCTMTVEEESALRHRGALVFPALPELPFNPYQPRLYTPEDLYDAVLDGGDYAASRDALVYAWTLKQGPQPDLDATLSTALHDHAVSDALDELCLATEADRSIGIMGGHAAARGSQDYLSAARLAGELTRGGRLVMTGGGPGAMEAGNLGAYLAGQPDQLEQAVEVLTAHPDFHADLTGWARAALEVRARWQASGTSVGIPTWFYGHEPPNAFATHVAKYFSNAIREDTLLQRCKGGIVYLSGAAGTVQEIFQAATANYYAAEGAPTTPMVLVGVEHWTSRLPAWPLLEALGRDRAMGTRLHLVDHIDQAAELLLG
ncbi:hypothetical protein [Luteococcus peritonei]|uniref:LOG family protein n=1 Tax=Luteococcus peritonei TaxID=88874 RepID=A0ABW4RT06_9ACTN